MQDLAFGSDLALSLIGMLVALRLSLSGSVKILIGAVAQLVERFHGMEEARGSIPLSSTEVCACQIRISGGLK